MSRFWVAVRQTGHEAVQVSTMLFRLMVPVLIVVKLLQELGLVGQLGRALAPLMGLVGLPGSMGLAWATAMLTNLYGGGVVLASLLPGAPLTVAQTTVLTGMMLIAHSLPVELRIARHAGVRLRAMLLLRVLGALAFGALLNQAYRKGGWLQNPLVLGWHPAPVDASLWSWALQELYGLVLVFVVVLGLLITLRVLAAIGVTALLNRALRPLLGLLGIGPQAITITVIGVTLGLSYGGGLLIREGQAGHVPRHDVLYSLALLGLCHSLIEDTLLMLLVGGHVSGVLWARLAFALVLVYALVRVVTRLPAPVVERHLLRPPVVSRPRAADAEPGRS